MVWYQLGCFGEPLRLIQRVEPKWQVTHVGAQLSKLSGKPDQTVYSITCVRFLSLDVTTCAADFMNVPFAPGIEGKGGVKFRRPFNLQDSNPFLVCIGLHNVV